MYSFKNWKAYLMISRLLHFVLMWKENKLSKSKSVVFFINPEQNTFDTKLFYTHQMISSWHLVLNIIIPRQFSIYTLVMFYDEMNNYHQAQKYQRNNLPK